MGLGASTAPTTGAERRPSSRAIPTQTRSAAGRRRKRRPGKRTRQASHPERRSHCTDRSNRPGRMPRAHVPGDLRCRRPCRTRRPMRARSTRARRRRDREPRRAARRRPPLARRASPPPTTSSPRDGSSRRWNIGDPRPGVKPLEPQPVLPLRNPPPSRSPDRALATVLVGESLEPLAGDPQRDACGDRPGAESGAR